VKKKNGERGSGWGEAQKNCPRKGQGGSTETKPMTGSLYREENAAKNQAIKRRCSKSFTKKLKTTTGEGEERERISDRRGKRDYAEQGNLVAQAM